MAEWPNTLPSPQKNISITPGDTRKERKLQSGRTEFRRFGDGMPDQAKVIFRLIWAEWNIFKEFHAHELNLGINWFSASWLADLGYNAHKARILGYPRQVALQNYYVDVSLDLIIQKTAWIVGEDSLWQCAASEIGWLGLWEYRIKCTIDATKIDEELIDFPVYINVSNLSGITLKDITDIFQSAAISPVNDDFTGDDGDPPNPVLWIEEDPHNIVSIQSNKLNVTAAGAGDKVAKVVAKWNLAGDFDIQVDFDIVVLDAPVTSVNYANVFYVTFADGKNVIFGRARTTVGRNGYYKDGSDDTWVFHNNADNVGKIRLVRNGSTLKAFYWRNSRWEWDGNVAGLTFNTASSADTTVVRLYSKQENNENLNVNYDNFTVNSGTVFWDAYPKKIAVTTSDGTTQCYVESVSWDVVSKKAEIHVKVPKIFKDDDTILYFYFDKNQLDNDTYVGKTTELPAKNVWDDDFFCVYHYEQITGLLLDSTSHAHHGTCYNLSEVERSQDGLMGHAYDFNGIEYIGLPDNNYFKPNFIAIEFVCKTDIGNPDNSRLLDRYEDPDFGYALLISNAGKGCVMVRVTGSLLAIAHTTDIIEGDGDWHYLFGSYDGTTAKIYTDGILDGSDNQSGVIIHNVAQEPRIGDGVFSNIYKGQICESRMSSSPRSSAWVKATQYSIQDNLITFSNTEQIQE